MSIELIRDGQVAILEIGRPERQNALDDAAWTALRKLVITLSDHPPKGLIVTGAGATFCAGIDLAEDNPLFARLQPLIKARDAYAIQELLTGLKAPFDALGRLPCPVIAAIEGSATGAGLELALVCDLRV